jgi:hypothetical protein
MPELKTEQLAHYLNSLLGEPVTILKVVTLGDATEHRALKEYGYGTPVRLDYEVAGHQRHSAALHTISPGSFGHEHMADRAHVLLWEHQAFNRLPRHVRSLDVCGFQSDGSIISLGKVREACLLTEYAEGQNYSLDLERVRDSGALTDLDLARADALCDYLLAIHAEPVTDSGLYTRRIRELLGHGECIMGLIDSYPHHLFITANLLQQIEHRCVEWRWRIKGLSHRLRQVHGDFHPWNILFRNGVDFKLLDRSRGEYGDPADDLTSLTLNYFFFSLQRSGRLEGPLETLFLRFWNRYLEKSGDGEILRVVAPFFAFRGLVIASPLWYPTLSDTVRRSIFAFILGVLESESFDPGRVNTYAGV